MSLIFIFPASNTIAFGGVATGNMKANEQETATPSIRYNGLIFRTDACVCEEVLPIIAKMEFQNYIQINNVNLQLL